MTDSPLPATIHERGNGFPKVGAYVAGDGQLYRVVAIEHAGRIQQSRNAGDGRSNWIHATVTPVDWSDCADGDEFPARVQLTRDAAETGVQAPDEPTT